MENLINDDLDLSPSDESEGDSDESNDESNSETDN